ncbi:MAG: multi-sensor signal transduction histidine kinase [Pedosphaera sp.]|nr:multi-sensor signal transduction histidine kinase [Pedosphaera sp.]
MPGTILFVDDEIEMCFMVSNLFRHYGYNIITAETVDVALDSSDGIPLDVIVLDVNLAGEDGLKLMTFLHRNNPDVPIILYTGMQHDDDVVQKAIKDGAHTYLRKGGPLEELVRAVEQASGQAPAV